MANENAVLEEDVILEDGYVDFEILKRNYKINWTKNYQIYLF